MSTVVDETLSLFSMPQIGKIRQILNGACFFRLFSKFQIFSRKILLNSGIFGNRMFGQNRKVRNFWNSHIEKIIFCPPMVMFAKNAKNAKVRNFWTPKFKHTTVLISIFASGLVTNLIVLLLRPKLSQYYLLQSSQKKYYFQEFNSVLRVVETKVI